MATSDKDALAARYFQKEDARLDPEERAVLAALGTRRPISRDAADIDDEHATFGDRASDRVAAIGGSWGFILVFTAVLVGWMLLNTDVLVHWGLEFDPYPYVFLNLMLSTLAAVQAPIIMMSQNRQAAKDRTAASHDYEVNLRAELEIMRLHEKLDALREENAILIRALDRPALRHPRESGDPAATSDAGFPLSPE